jgi:hypothetical protein
MFIRPIKEYKLKHKCDGFCRTDGTWPKAKGCQCVSVLPDLYYEIIREDRTALEYGDELIGVYIKHNGTEHFILAKDFTESFEMVEKEPA